MMSKIHYIHKKKNHIATQKSILDQYTLTGISSKTVPDGGKKSKMQIQYCMMPIHSNNCKEPKGVSHKNHARPSWRKA